MSTAEHSQMASQVALAERESETPAAPDTVETRSVWYRRLRRPWIVVPVVVVVGSRRVVLRDPIGRLVGRGGDDHHEATGHSDTAVR